MDFQAGVQQGIGDRLKLIRKELSETQKGIAALLGVSFRTYQEWEAENTVPNGKYLHKVCQLGYNINWLLTGEGDMKVQREIGVTQDISAMSSAAPTALELIAKTRDNIQTFKVETSAMEPEINRGDLVFYDMNENTKDHIVDSALYVVRLGGTSSIRRLIYKDSTQIEAVNNYSSFILDENSEILGRVHYCLQAK